MLFQAFVLSALLAPLATALPTKGDQNGVVPNQNSLLKLGFLPGGNIKRGDQHFSLSKSTDDDSPDKDSTPGKSPSENSFPGKSPGDDSSPDRSPGGNPLPGGPPGDDSSPGKSPGDSSPDRSPGGSPFPGGSPGDSSPDKSPGGNPFPGGSPGDDSSPDRFPGNGFPPQEDRRPGGDRLSEGESNKIVGMWSLIRNILQRYRRRRVSSRPIDDE